MAAIQSPAVSGAQTYPELCMAIKNDEKYQAELKKWQMVRFGTKTLRVCSRLVVLTYCTYGQRLLLSMER